MDFDLCLYLSICADFSVDYRILSAETESCEVVTSAQCPSRCQNAVALNLFGYTSMLFAICKKCDNFLDFLVWLHGRQSYFIFD